MKPIPRWKMAVMIWLGIYPTITALIYIIFPLTKDWPVPLRTLAMTLIAVPVMVFLVLPLIQKWLKNWLNK
jgi:antibiotic biosynthesis monooxygenase (ABM) superfamily enzyme